MADAPSKEELASANQHLKGLLKKVREEGKSMTQKVVRTGSAAGSAFGLSWLEHRYPDKATILGMDLSLAVGLAASGAAAAGVIDDETTENAAEGVGTGGICAFSAKKGAIKGDEAKNKASSA